MKRLHYKATNEGKQVSTSAAGDCLYIDNVLVYSLIDGFIRTSLYVSNSNHHSDG